MNSQEIRQKFLDFFEKRGHTVVPSASLVPENDPSVLFTTAGMQQFKPYYIGQKDATKDFCSLNTVSIQKCVRTSDIDEVGDESHLTFFEMLGNFSFGGYWKKEAIQYAHEFITKEMGLKIDYVSVFEGEISPAGEVPADTESEEIWKNIDPNIMIKRAPRADNFWGPTGEEGPCGPTSEIYVDGLEVWNIVFNEFYQNKDKTLKPLDVKGIDTGMGFERLTKVVQKAHTVFDTDIFEPVISKIKSLSAETNIKAERIVADHTRTALNMILDGVRPSNTERGYILRRLLRRAIQYSDVLGLKEITMVADDGLAVIKEEEKKFRETLKEGLIEFEKGRDAFTLFTSYGFPLEMTLELAKKKGIEVDIADFDEKLKKHQELSRAGAEQKFKGGLAGHSDIEVRYHTATHLLHQALHEVLGEDVMQKGSNITTERTRFDFSFPRKLTDDEKQQVEDIVNKKISEGLPVNMVKMPKEEAEKLGARHFFGEKYPDEVNVYYIGEKLESAYSKEFCGGPHVKNISEIGKFRIIKEEAVSAGVRRIKAVIE